jgi:phosphoglycolate phosphatase-like HAD superfamily hydrolase
MKLVVFDLDGTLTQTSAVDEECFGRALAEGLGIDSVNTNWLDYEHVTDLGVFSEVFRHHRGCAPDASDVAEFVECFVELLSRGYGEAKEALGEVQGATAFLRALKEQTDWVIAVATGSFERSARVKLAAAGIDAFECAAAFAEDGPSREGIVNAAIRRALEQHQRRQFERIVLVGDAAWDVHTATRLDLPLVGVGVGSRAEQMFAMGTTHVLQNYLDHDRCLRYLVEAAVPRKAGEH